MYCFAFQSIWVHSRFQWGSWCWFISFLCSELSTIVCLFLLVIALSVLPRCTLFDYSFRFFQTLLNISIWFLANLICIEEEHSPSNRTDRFCVLIVNSFALIYLYSKYTCIQNSCITKLTLFHPLSGFFEPFFFLLSNCFIFCFILVQVLTCDLWLPLWYLQLFLAKCLRFPFQYWKIPMSKM